MQHRMDELTKVKIALQIGLAEGTITPAQAVSALQERGVETASRQVDWWVCRQAWVRSQDESYPLPE